MKYTVVALAKVERELLRLPKKDCERVEEAILHLGQVPRPMNTKKLKGREAWRIRVGDYRRVYEIEGDSTLVRNIEFGHRREVYR